MLREPTTVRFLHVAMLQHDPEGRVAFMHRTAEGKFYPNRCVFALCAPWCCSSAEDTQNSSVRRAHSTELRPTPVCFGLMLWELMLPL